MRRWSIPNAVSEEGNPMADTHFKPRGVHLVGSVPLESNTAVFTLASTLLGRHLQRLPDGETGVRLGWIGWQRPIILGMPQLEQTSILGGVGGRYGTFPLLRL